jgi:hypothetical protein
MTRVDIATAALGEQAEQRIRLAATLLAAWRIPARVRAWDGTRCTLLVADLGDAYGRQAFARARARQTPVLAFRADAADLGPGVADASEGSPAPALAQTLRDLLAVEATAGIEPGETPVATAQPALCRLADPEFGGRAVDASYNGRRIRIRPDTGRVHAATLSDLLSARDSFASADWTLAASDEAPDGDGVHRSLEAFLLQAAFQGRAQLPDFPAGRYRLKDWPDVGSAPELVGALKIAKALMRAPAGVDDLPRLCGVDARDVHATLWAYRAANLLERPDAASAAIAPAPVQPIGAFSGMLARIASRFGLSRA